MSRLTPSRLIVIAITFSLFTFLWTFGLPRAPPEPVLPTKPHGEGSPLNAEKPVKALVPDPKAEQAKKPVSSLINALPTSVSRAIPSLTSPQLAVATGHAISSGTAERGRKEGDKVEAQETRGSSSTHTVKAAPPPFPTAHIKNNGTYTNATTVQTSCKDVPGASDIMVIIKTSKAELHNELPTQLDTLLSCVPHFAIFSDQTGMIRNYTVHDALEGVSAATKEKHNEFRYYENQKTGDRRLELVGTVAQDLERWKLLPMIYKAYNMRPQARWLMIIEPDTSLSWTNLVQWTKRLDSRIPYYAGAPLQLSGTKFVQRSPGILISKAALQQYVKTYDEVYESEWEPRVAKESLGDVVLAKAMSDAQVQIYNAHPLLQSQIPTAVSWTRQYWCTPAMSFHHMSQQSIKDAWNSQNNWTSKNGWKEPYLHRDAFSDLVKPLLLNRKDEWDNGSEGTSIARPDLDSLTTQAAQEWYDFDEDLRQAADSWEKCQEVCQQVGDCHQWKYSRKGQGECHLGKSIKFGVSASKKEVGGMWISGWIMERIQNSTREWQCDDVKWWHNQQ